MDNLNSAMYAAVVDTIRESGLTTSGVPGGTIYVENNGRTVCRLIIWYPEPSVAVYKDFSGRTEAHFSLAEPDALERLVDKLKELAS